LSINRRIEEVQAAVATVVDPCSIATGVPINLVEMGMLLEVALEGDAATVTLCVTSPVCWQAMNIVDAVQHAVERIDGIERATCQIDAAAEWMPEMMDDRAQTRLRRMRPIRRENGKAHAEPGPRS
jgi:metal-sulfur cluster biosynthetic enzyme